MSPIVTFPLFMGVFMLVLAFGHKYPKGRR